MNDYRPIHRSPLLRLKHLLQQPPRHRGAEGHRLQARKTKQTGGGTLLCKPCEAKRSETTPGLSASSGAASGLAKPSQAARRGEASASGAGMGAGLPSSASIGWAGARGQGGTATVSSRTVSSRKGGARHSYPDVPLLRDLARWPPAVRMRHGRAVRGRVPVSTMHRGGALAAAWLDFAGV